MIRKAAYNTGFASGGVTCKLGAMCFYSSFVQVDSFVLRNPPERKARKRYAPLNKTKNRNMKKFTLILGLVVLMTACDFLNKEKKAIEICQNSKFQVQTNNIFGNLAANMYGLNADATWLDFANMLAQKEPNKKHDWSAKKTDVDGVYMVAFTDERGWGHRWEVIIDEQIVKHINANEYLSRK
jgi:hypothetical protein